MIFITPDENGQRGGRFKYFLKLDIRKYFDSIDHGAMMAKLPRRFKDRDLLDLFSKILGTYHTRPGKGMPIGNLISQHLANFYLGAYDHWVKEARRIKGYVRYMDDFVLFAENKAILKEELAETESFLEKDAALRLKPNIQLNRCDRGIPFLGFRVFPQTIRLSPRSRKRFVEKLKKYERKWQNGEFDDGELGRRMLSVAEFTRAGHSLEFRRKAITPEKEYPVNLGMFVSRRGPKNLIIRKIFYCNGFEMRMRPLETATILSCCRSSE